MRFALALPRDAPSTIFRSPRELRMVPLPRFTGEEKASYSAAAFVWWAWIAAHTRLCVAGMSM